MTVVPFRYKKVFGLGLARTGTTALHEAMGILGIRSAPSSALLIDGLDDEFLARYDAFFDNPIPFLEPELSERFPEAGYIVTWRPIDPWLTSMEWLFGPGLDRLDPETRLLGDRVHRSVYGFDRFDRGRLRAVYESHYGRLRDWSAGRQDVLWLDQSEGFAWDPLCRFLGVSAPSVAFPVANRAIYPASNPASNPDGNRTAGNRTAASTAGGAAKPGATSLMKRLSGWLRRGPLRPKQRP